MCLLTALVDRELAWLISFQIAQLLQHDGFQYQGKASCPVRTLPNKSLHMTTIILEGINNHFIYTYIHILVQLTLPVDVVFSSSK